MQRAGMVNCSPSVAVISVDLSAVFFVYFRMITSISDAFRLVEYIPFSFMNRVPFPISFFNW